MTENGLDRAAALAAVDGALATGRVTADDPLGRQLQDLALAIEAESELPSEEFARELGERVDAGFPRAHGGLARVAGLMRLRPPSGRATPGRPPSGRAPRPSRRLRPLAALAALSRSRAIALASAAATLLIAIGVAVEVSREEPGSEDLVPEQPALSVPEGEPVPPVTSPAADGQQRFAQAVPAAGGGQARVAPRVRERRIERSAELTLAAPDDRLDDVADSIVRVTDRHRGFVLRSSVASGDDSEQGGSFDLRIPAESLQLALRDLSKLGHVRARRQAGRDITPAFVSSRERLDTARAERRGLLRRLEQAGGDDEAARLRSRLDTLALRIERLRRELGALRERTDYGAVTVELEGTESGGGGTTGGTGEAFDDSLALLEGTLALLVRVLGVLVPLALVAGLGWLGGRMLRRRRREATLR